jgi:peptidoglycan/LPS O-acetylase OafA/YrhL
MLAHYRGMFFVEYRLLPESQHNIFTQIFYLLTRFGEQPVIVFFVLSGFLVGGRAIENILNKDVNIKSYCINRFVRIFLPLIASSILVIIIDLVMSAPIPFGDILGSLFSFQVIFTSCSYNPPLWSLAYEVWFYIMMGCIMTISIRKKDGTNSIYAFLIFVICIYFFLILKPIYLLIWLMGALAYLLPRENISYKKIKILSLIILLSISFGLSQSVSDSRSIKITLFSFLNDTNISIFLALITCLLVHYIITAVPKKKIEQQVEEIGSKLASFSYSLYLTHYPLMRLLSYYGFPKSEQINVKSISLYFLELTIGLITAYLIYLISENHTYTIKKIIKAKF